jgi:RNA polymerase sigma factor for flagellar operon FliA
MLTTTPKPDVATTPLDPAERQRLLAENLPEVRYIARRIHDRLPSHVPFDDLVHAGILGLIDAVDKFDAGKNVQLKSYAHFRIRGAILDSLRQMDWSPRNLRRQARRIEDANRDLSAELGRAPTEPELAERLGLPLTEFQQLLGELRCLDLGSLQAQFEANGGDDPGSVIATRPEENPFQLTLRSEMRVLLADAIEELEEKERQVLGLYYLEELTMKEVGAILGIGESLVSQIHTAALIRLRSRLQGRVNSSSGSRNPGAPDSTGSGAA